MKKTWYYAQYELNKFPMFTSCFETLAEVEKDVKPYLSVMDNLEYKKREVEQDVEADKEPV